VSDAGSIARSNLTSSSGVLASVDTATGCEAWRRARALAIMSWRASRNALRFSSSEAGALASAGADVLRKGGAIEVDERASVVIRYGRHTES
jgi:hypothetical protein